MILCFVLLDDESLLEDLPDAIDEQIPRDTHETDPNVLDLIGEFQWTRELM